MGSPGILVEVWSGMIKRQAIRRGVFHPCTIHHQIWALRRRLNRRKHPFNWTKTPDQILAKIKRKTNFVSEPPVAPAGGLRLAGFSDSAVAAIPQQSRSSGLAIWIPSNSKACIESIDTGLAAFLECPCPLKRIAVVVLSFPFLVVAYE